MRTLAVGCDGIGGHQTDHVVDMTGKMVDAVDNGIVVVVVVVDCVVDYDIVVAVQNRPSCDVLEKSGSCKSLDIPAQGKGMEEYFEKVGLFRVPCLKEYMNFLETLVA